ncbi:kinase-like protein [Mytilinidion resinicola]|uniref:non-specific serine/threonine protein kinase n=1 Tax=Mytilinidion resinicola TaxID=574789 RepID=A0A6A6YF93_9PEZI|nr:kinase-like protein [Mytilinidion resinicola]KAF2807248.1 kinase-like protein [Mytilinidion resinicola]
MDPESMHSTEHFCDNYEHIRSLSAETEGIVEVFSRRVSPKELIVAKIIRQNSSTPGITPQEVVLLSRTGKCDRIVKLLGHIPSFPNPRTSAILLEFCRHESLYDYADLVHANRFHIPEEQIWRLFEQLAEALAFLHRSPSAEDPDWRPIVHRDIKPANMLLTSIPDAPGRNIDVKLADFGLSAFYDPSDCWFEAGTAEYQPPEQTLWAPYARPAGDVWAVGSSIHHLLHRKFTIEDPAEFASKWKQDYPTEDENMRDHRFFVRAVPRRVFPINKPLPWGGYQGYSDRLNSVFLSALAFDPTERPPAVELLRYIEDSSPYAAS